MPCNCGWGGRVQVGGKRCVGLSTHPLHRNFQLTLQEACFTTDGGSHDSGSYDEDGDEAGAHRDEDGGYAENGERGK